MKQFVLAVALAALVASPAMAQESGVREASGYVSAFAGPAWAAGNSTGSIVFEGGARIAPHVMLFGSLGRFSNLQGDLQPTLQSTTATLAGDGIGVAGGGTLPAWYGIGGVRAEIPTNLRVTPYVLGGFGMARLNPQPQFTFASGTLPDGTTPTVGLNVTSNLLATGTITTPPPSNALMAVFGGGIEVPLVPHWVGDVGYRYSYIAADQSLSASALNTNVLTFGIGYRF